MGAPGTATADPAAEVIGEHLVEERPKGSSQGTVFGDLLRSVRTASHLSIGDLARDAGCSQAIVSRYEAGEAVPKRESAARIVRALTERVSKVGGTVSGIDARTARADGVRLHMALDSSDGLLPGVRAPMSKFVSRLSLDDVQRCILGVDNIERDRELIAVIAKCVQSSKHFRILFRDKVGWQAFRSALLQEPGCAEVCLTRVKAYVVRSDVQSIVFAPNFAICELVGDRTLGAWLHRVNAATSFVDSCEGMDEGSVARVFEAIVRQLLIANTTDLGFLSPVDQ